VELLVVIAIIGILVALLLPAIQAAREAARRTQCQTNLHNLSLGVLNYDDAHKSFPYAISNPLNPNTGNHEYTTGQQMTASTAKLYANWAIQVLPMIEEQPLYDSFVLYEEATGTALNDFANRTPRGTQLQVMLCPSDEGRGQYCSMSGGNWARGNYGLNVGLGFIWDQLDESAARYPWRLRCGRGVATVNKGAKISQIEDGTSKTIMLAELRVGLSDKDRRGTWAMPMVGSNLVEETASNFGGPPNDCEPGNDDITDEEAIEADVGIARLTAECMTMGWNNSASVTVRSRHPGGAYVALCDGSVRFITDNINCVRLGPGFTDPTTGVCPDQEAAFGVWQRINSANDGFTLSGSEY
ncbi:MAG TPA: DUF1559 domain-containing protein, partial [Lacipirellulaceae bacterium]|nr:DUF1559 domain-containing protein [Lacipirellulaceae bacterium]